MCGICGEIRFDDQPPSTEAVARMREVMVPRGPDGAGLFQAGAIATGHRRLKIIDLSEHAQQPMLDPELGLGIVFNGCIYNYKQLRRNLENRGHAFTTNSDTEVIVHLYEEYGENFVDELSGMFAIAIWDSECRKLILARDRLGQKPLFYASCNGDFVFASEIKGILRSGLVSRDLDPGAIYRYIVDNV